MYKPKDIFLPALVEGNVMTTGGDLNLAVGQLAIVDLTTSTKDGCKVLSDFTPLSASAKLQLRVGEPNDYVSRSEDNKSVTTVPFNLKDVTNIYVDAPQRPGAKFDDFVIGYNGKDGTEIDLENAENEVIELCLQGDLMGMIGLPDNRFDFRVGLTAPIEGTKNTTSTTAPADEWTMHEIVENAYLELKNRVLPGNIPITKYVDIMLVNSNNPETLPGTAQTFYNLVVKDEGTQSNLGAVQAQYPDLNIKKVEWDHAVGTTYSTIATSLPAAYQPKANTVLKGCATCPAGYTELAEGFVYEVVIEDPTDQTAVVQTIPGATASTASLNDTDGDTNTYSVVTNDELTEAEIAAFIDANEGTKEINLVSADVVDVCQSATPASTAWTEGESCNAITENYTITLADNECGESRLTELRATYPDLTITEDSAANCQRVYSTTVVSDLVCEECAPIFRETFSTEAPDMFDGVSWSKAAKVYDGTAKMGIRIRGKEAVLSGGELLRDEMPFIYDSVEIGVSGGYQMYTNESYLAGTNDRFTVKKFSRKANPQNLGGNLWKFEEEGQIYHRGRSRYVGNNYAKLVNGQESRLNGTDQYIVYSFTVAPGSFQSMSKQPSTNAMTYHIPVEIGKQGAVEDLFNKLATATGLPQVQAISK